VALIVQKFGGTSVANLERIRNVARRALRTQAEGHDVVVIVSAMSGETNRLLGLGHEAARAPEGAPEVLPDTRELDALAATGEQVSAALTALAIQAAGGRARSFLGHQIKVLTDRAFTKARIVAIDASRVTEAVRSGHVAVVAGFQGVDDEGNITTLGRGGSDTSAVAVAAAMGADVCEIYTDVDGVYTADPNVVPSARKIERISYEEMLELASLGAKVLQIRSVEVAMKYQVPVHVRSSFSDAPGTWVTGEADTFESVLVTGVTCDKNDARVLLVGVDDRPGVVAEVFGALAESNISVDMIVQSAPSAPSEGTKKADVTFTVGKSDLPKTRAIIEQVASRVGALTVRFDEDCAKVSIVGAGMRSHAGVAAKMFQLLAAESINIQAISTSEIKVSCLVAPKYAELAVRALHDGFSLGSVPTR
jgi:aspartate kinase